MRKRKGGVFVPSVALALAAHAVLFLLAARAIGRVPTPVYAPAVDLVEVQLAVKGDAGSGGSASAHRPEPRRLPPPAKPAPAVPPSPSPAVTPAGNVPAPASKPELPSSPAVAPAETTAGTGGGSGTGSGAAGQGTGSGSGAGSGDGVGSGDSGAEGPGSGGVGPIADINPVPVRDIAATYPASARRLGQQGLVRVETVIDEMGVVTSELIAASSGFGSLDNAALDAVKRTRFLPAMKNGKPVACRIIIPVRFRLQEH